MGSTTYRRMVALLCSMLLSLAACSVADSNPSETPQPTNAFSAADDAALERLLAPIALHPDPLLSHILVATTYPLQLLQLAQWRQQNSHLDDAAVLAAVEERDWDPSVKALAPFPDLLQSLSSDLDWLEQVGQAFLADENRVLDRIQQLRQRARDAGQLEGGDHWIVEEKDETIVIEPVQREMIYVPYYDTRVVYGSWWRDQPPYHWHSPSHYYRDSGFFWSPRVYIGAGFYFSSLHWRHRHLLVDYHWRDRHRYGLSRGWHSDLSQRQLKRWRHHRRNDLRFHQVRRHPAMLERYLDRQRPHSQRHQERDQRDRHERHRNSDRETRALSIPQEKTFTGKSLHRRHKQSFERPRSQFGQRSPQRAESRSRLQPGAGKKWRDSGSARSSTQKSRQADKLRGRYGDKFSRQRAGKQQNKGKGENKGHTRRHPRFQ